MRILQFCKKLPYPLKDGEAIAITNLTKGFYQQGHQVDVLAINTLKHHFPVEELPPDVKAIANYYAVTVNTTINAIDALSNLVSDRSYHIQRFISEDVDRQLRELLTRNSYDLIQFEGLYLTPYIPTIRSFTQVPVALRAHNIEYEIWERIAQNETNPVKRWYLSLLTKRLKKYEIASVNTYDAIVAITDRDQKRFEELGAQVPLHNAPAGVDLSNLVPDDSALTFPSLLFLGGLDWMPNQEGLKWFLNEVWPRLNQEFPDLTFHIAGRNQPEWMSRINASHVHVLGEVEDAQALMQSKAVMVVPLFSGSGMRIKVIEGMAMERAVVSTSLGVEGISAEDNVHLCIADSAGAFAEKIAQCIRNREFYDELRQNGRKFIENHFDYREVAKDVLSFYQERLKV